MNQIRKVSAWDINNRFADLSPTTYDAKGRTVQAVLSAGAAVKRDYGTEILLLEAGAVNLDRLSSCGVPLIDSHNIFGIDGVLGRVERAWLDGGNLLGLIAFDDSKAGRDAEGQVSRGMIRSVSIGYRVDEWKITDADGNVINPERMRWDGEYTFTATRWTLLEASLVSVPADPHALIRSHAAGNGGSIGHDGASQILARMATRQRECERYCASLQSPPAASHDSEAARDSNGFSYGLPRRRRYPGQGRH